MSTLQFDGSAAAAFTVYVRHNISLFADEAVVKKYEEILLAETEKSHCEAPIYLFMPDKCHLLLQGKGGLANLVSTMRGFRLGAGYWFSKTLCDAKWHEDHGCDSRTNQQEIMQYVRHILNAPVRIGIVPDWKQYRYKGSTLYDLETWV